MAHISSLGAAMYTDLSISTGVVDASKATAGATVMPANVSSIADFEDLFVDETTAVAGSFRRVPDVRTFPAIGTPANLVRVPVFGSKTSQTIQGQADAPSLELTVNFIPSKWAKGTAAEGGTILGNMVGDGVSRVMRFTLLQIEPQGATGARYASSAAGLGSVPNSQYFFYGKLESCLVNTSLTDSVTATVAVSLQSEFYGAYTTAGA